ncbi:MAG: glycosyltransferase family 4 protein [Candidatus Dormibacteraeota bacterium]|nr:glycosyltransferase family 4 protein [Candidatus Dormibacteraeota bacterium]
MCADGGRYALVVEQTLGHVAHSRNLERALTEHRVDAELIKLEYRPALTLPRLERLPGLRTWSYQASREARARVRERLREGPLDGLFVHTQVAALLLPQLMRTVPTIVSLDATPRNVDQLAAAYDHRRQPEYLERLKVQLNKRVFDAAAALVTWCHWAARSLERDYRVDARRIRVIHPGVDLRLFSRVSVRRPGPPRILFVGGQFERKGGNDLLQAMVRLGDTAELDLVTGDDPTLPQGVPVRVHRGLRPQSPELLELFQQADIFALPSHGDCFPQAVAEAMASGLPVVATNVGAIPEMVQEGVTGYLVRRSDPRQLAQALTDLVGSPSRRAAMGRAGQRLARDEHDATRNNQAILDLLAQLSNGARQRQLRRPA